MQKGKENLQKDSAISEKNAAITKSGVEELSDEELGKVAGGDLCPPGWRPVNNGCEGEDDW